MILISGTDLVKEDLPEYDLMDYQIENDVRKMGIKLKTSAKSDFCFKIYISEDYKAEYTITDEVSEKLEYFKDDDDLLRLLNNESDNSAAPSEEPVEEEKVEVPEFDKPLITVNLEKEEESTTEVKEDKKESKSKKSKVEDIEIEEETNSLIPKLDLEEANTELPDVVKMIPNIGDDVDSLKLLLKTKDGVIAQKDGLIQELKNKIEETYKLQEIQLEEVENLYRDKMAECQNLIKELEGKGKGAALDEETSKFLKYINYAQSNKAISKEGLTEDEIADLGSLHSKYTICAWGSGDSCYSMLKQMKQFLQNKNNYLVLDFSNDNYLASTFKLVPKDKNTMRLLRDDIDPISLLTDINNIKFIPTTSYNDIALLNINWGKILRKIDDLAGGMDVIMLFGSISNFNVRYTVSKLATIGKLYVFAKSSPIIFSSLYSDVQFIPKNRVRIIALEYIDMVKTILAEFSKSYEIYAFSGDVEWGKLGL